MVRVRVLLVKSKQMAAVHTPISRLASVGDLTNSRSTKLPSCSGTRVVHTPAATDAWRWHHFVFPYITLVAYSELDSPWPLSCFVIVPISVVATLKSIDKCVCVQIDWRWGWVGGGVWECVCILDVFPSLGSFYHHLHLKRTTMLKLCSLIS